MAIAITTPSVAQGFIKNATSADVSGCEEICAAVADKKIKISHLSIQSDDAISLTLGAGKTGAGVTTALIGPLPFGAGDFRQWSFFPSYLWLPVFTALTIDGGAGQVWIFCQGFIQ